MNMMDVTREVIYQTARKTSAGKGIDEHWTPVLPEALNCAANEISLVLNRAHVNPLMEEDAARYAQTLPPRDISNLDNGTLSLHYYTRFWLMGMSKEPLFHTLVDQSYGVKRNTRSTDHWVRPSLIWLPRFKAIMPHVRHSLVERYKHYFFAERCYSELLSRGRKNPYMRHTFIQLTDDPDLYHLRKEGSEWLHEASRRIAASVGAQPEVGEEVKQDRLVELLPLPLHRQIQGAGSTGIEIKHRVYDIQHRKGGQHKPIYLDDLDDRLINNMPNTSTIHSHEGTDVERLLECLQSCQAKIEKVLSKGKPKLGKRRFKVMEMLTHTSCQKMIAKALNVSEGTITGDIKIIKKARDRIKEILYD